MSDFTDFKVGEDDEGWYVSEDGFPLAFGLGEDVARLFGASHDLLTALERVYKTLMACPSLAHNDEVMAALINAREAIIKANPKASI